MCNCIPAWGLKIRVGRWPWLWDSRVTLQGSQGWSTISNTHPHTIVL